MSLANHLFDTLNTKMINSYMAVNENKNHVAVNIEDLSQKQLLYIISQYATFSRKITSFLFDAFYAMEYASINGLKNEIMTNISEELGNGVCNDSDNIQQESHYSLLRRGFYRKLNIDLSEVEVKHSTMSFINAIHNTVSNHNSYFVAGGVYALESTATPELKMTYSFFKKLFDMYNLDMPTEVINFFEGHINEIEVLHESRLKDECIKAINNSNHIIDFENGFHEVMKIMDSWWSGLYTESLCIN